MGCYTVTPGIGEIVDSEHAEQMAEEAGGRPEVKRWIGRLRRLIHDMPTGLEVFVGESISVLATGPDGARFMTRHGCSDPCAVIASFHSKRWDGGGW